jgi:LPS-assembly protein
VGFRETYYSARVSNQSAPEILARSLKRRYTDVVIDVRPPTLEKEFSSGWIGSFKHVVEPVITYRWITGIKDLHETIRFDSEDAIANTNEVEYGVVNRFFRTTEGKDQRYYEFLTVSLKQKYYFDPTFGGALIPGEPNAFYPMDTLTAFSHSSIVRNLAPTSIIVRVSPGPSVSHDFRTDYDTKLQRFRDVSLSTYWRQGDFLIAGSYFKTQAVEPGTLDRDHIQGQTAYGNPYQGFSASVTLSYNIQSGTLLNSHSRLNYMWDCCGLSMEFQQFALGLRTESRFSFSFTLKGIGSFGNIKRSESLF